MDAWIIFTLTLCFSNSCWPQINLNFLLMIAADHCPQKLSWSKFNMISFLGEPLFIEMLLHTLKESRFGGTWKSHSCKMEVNSYTYLSKWAIDLKQQWHPIKMRAFHSLNLNLSSHCCPSFFGGRKEASRKLSFEWNILIWIGHYSIFLRR